MKFANFLKSNDEWNYIKNTLESKCQPFINDMKGFKHFLYRGTNSHSKNINFIKTRPNRTPVDTKLPFHDTFNDIFKKRYGWKARSENVIFSFGSQTPALTYGDLYFVFPVGKYEYLWSKHVFDLTSTFGAYLSDWIIRNLGAEYHNDETIQNIHKTNHFDKLISEFENEFLSTYIKGKSGDGGIYQAAKSNNEIMIHCNEYYLVDTKFKKHIQKDLA